MCFNLLLHQASRLVNVQYSKNRWNIQVLEPLTPLLFHSVRFQTHRYKESIKKRTNPYLTQIRFYYLHRIP
jgi:hypothetical protein